MTKPPAPEPTDEPTVDDETPVEDEPTVEPTPEDPGQQPDETNDEYKKRYKGLQKASAKKSKELQDALAKANTEIDELTTKMESGGITAEELKASRDTLKSALDLANKSVAALSLEKKALEKTQERQEVLAESHPNLIKMAKFIPPGKDLEEYKANVEDFAASLGTLVNDGVEDEFKGVTPPPPGGEDVTGANDEDKLYAKVMSLAGDPDKTTEYTEAYDQYLVLFDKANPNQ